MNSKHQWTNPGLNALKATEVPQSSLDNDILKNSKVYLAMSALYSFRTFLCAAKNGRGKTENSAQGGAPHIGEEPTIVKVPWTAQVTPVWAP